MPRNAIGPDVEVVAHAFNKMLTGRIGKLEMEKRPECARKRERRAATLGRRASSV